MAFPPQSLFPSLWTKTVEQQVPWRAGLWDLPLGQGKSSWSWERSAAPVPRAEAVCL